MTTRSNRTTALLIALLILILSVLPAYAAPEDYSVDTPANLREDYLYGESAIAIDAETGEILFNKNARIRMYPASTTKMMTLILALESGYDLNTPVTLPPETNDIPEDSSKVPVYRGDTMSFRDLLYAMMLKSDNGAANAVAVLLGGSIPNFVQMMNNRAAQLGCEGTHFVNAHGYHDENHYSTAQDLALIATELLRFPIAREIVATESYEMNVIRDNQSTVIPISNSNSLLREGSTYYFEDCIGVKTGTHSRAGKCFVGAAEKDGVTLVSVTLNCAEDNHKWIDSIRLFRYGFTCYTPYTLEQMFKMAGTRFAPVRISNAKTDDPLGGLLELGIAQVSDPTYERMIQTNSDGALTASLDDFASRCTLQITDNLAAPISAGEIVGTYSYTAKDGQVITASLIASRNIEAQPEPTTLYDVFPFLRMFGNPLVQLLIIVIALLIIVIMLYRSAKRKRVERQRREIYNRRRKEQRYRSSNSRTHYSGNSVNRRSAPAQRPSTRIPPRDVSRPQNRPTNVRRTRRDDDFF